MTTIQDMTQRVSELSAAIKELESEKSDLISQISIAWSIGDLDEYLNDKGHAIVDNVQIERRSRTTWAYSTAVKALQEQEQRKLDRCQWLEEIVEKLKQHAQQESQNSELRQHQGKV